MLRTIPIAAALAAVALVAAAPAAPEPAPPAVVNVGDFEGDVTPAGLPNGWEELHFEKIPRHTAYSVVKEGENAWVHAAADRSASSLFKRIDVDLKEHPILTWRWRIDRVIAKGDVRKKKTDDVPARVYVNFRYDPARVGRWTRWKYERARKRLGEYPPLCGFAYIWANKLPQDTFLQSAYADDCILVAVRSGGAEAGRWVTERRNVYEDYKRAFGGEPPRIIQVAVMTDSDNTGSKATTDFDDIRFEAPTGK